MSEKPQVPSQYSLADPVQFAQNMAKVFEQARRSPGWWRSARSRF